MALPGEICPSCKLRNKPGAILCTFCGAPLKSSQPDARSTDRLRDEGSHLKPRHIDYNSSLVPEAGLGIYLENTVPVTVIRDEDAILGRRVSGTGGLVVDLAPFGAIQLGVSRQHAVIHLKKDGYYITDLDSTNGTQVNTKRLAPNKPQRLSSGDVVRLGRLNLLVLFK